LPSRHERPRPRRWTVGHLEHQRPRLIARPLTIHTTHNSVALTQSTMFQTNGSTHHNGVSNEHATIDLLNEHQVYPATVTHLGGTKHKADAMAGDKGISIKHKAGLKNGSFDWVNTSDIFGVIDRTIFADFFAFVSEARSWSVEKREAIVEETRDLFNECCEKALDSIHPHDLLNFLKSNITEKQHGMGIVINDTAHETLHIMEADRLIMTRCINSNYSPELIKGRGKSSRRLVFSSCAVPHAFDCGIRVRVTSNNGIRAFLGLSKANKSSQVVIKVQQDNVREFVTSDPDRQILTYAA